MKTDKYNVTGMTCSACSARVEKTVSVINGVKSVSVNLLTNRMKVEYDDKKISADDIIKAVEDVGYGAKLYDNKNSVGTNSTNTSNKNLNSIYEIKSMKNRLVWSIIFLVPLMYISMGHMLHGTLSILVPEFIHRTFYGNENAITFAFTQLLLLIPILYLNRKFFIVGYKSLYKKSPNMDTLIALGSTAATLYGVFVIYKLGFGLGHNNMTIVDKYVKDIYFESAGTILTLITIGKYFETKSKGKTSEAIKKLMDLAPKNAIIEKNGVEIEIPVENVQLGDIFIIKPGSSVPVDGEVIEGFSSIDESAITGESIPVEKTVGDNLSAATINKAGYLKVKATRVGADTTINQIIELVEEASSSKAPIAKLADKVSGIFVPIVITIALVTSLIWLLSGATFEFALSVGIAVLVISCPCALGLATPVAIMVGTGKGAENGILIKSGEALEIAHSIDTVVLDKTGTITEGKPYVTDVVPIDIEENLLVEIAMSLEKSSEHPLAEAIVKYSEEKNIRFKIVKNFEAIFGKGIKGEIDGKKYFAGNIAMMNDLNIEMHNINSIVNKFSEEGKTLLIFADEKKVIGVIAVADIIKENSKKAIDLLKKMNIDVIMLTGDNKKTAYALQKQINMTDVIAEVLPQQKEEKIISLQNAGKKVAMIGDGINDSPSLARADVGIAIGAGTDVAIESADIVLVKSDLMDAVTAIKLSKSVIRNIKENLFWAFFYNALCIPLAAGVFYPMFNIKLNPMFGAAAMSFSSIFVVFNALRLKFFKVDHTSETDKIKNNRIKLNEIENNNFKNNKIDTNEKFENRMEEVNMFGSKKYDIEMLIEGMSCSHCSGRVEDTLNSLEGVKAKVDLKKKIAYINLNSDLSNDVLRLAVENQGYKVIDIKNK